MGYLDRFIYMLITKIVTCVVSSRVSYLGGSWLRLSARKPAILIEVFLSPTRQILG